jgi:hypothetical protein
MSAMTACAFIVLSWALTKLAYGHEPVSRVTVELCLERRGAHKIKQSHLDQQAKHIATLFP